MDLPARLKAGDRLQRAEEFAPGAALFGEALAAFGRMPVVAPSALTSFLDPLSFDPPTSFHPVQHGVERGDVKPEHSARPIVNQRFARSFGSDYRKTALRAYQSQKVARVQPVSGTRASS